MKEGRDELRNPDMPARALAIKPPDFPSAVRHWWRAYENLLFIRWANIRNEWYFGVIVGMLFPIAIMIFMKFSGSTTDPATGLYVASGNARCRLS